MTATAPPDPTPGARRWTAGRIVVTILVIGMVAMWGYVLYLAFGPGRQDPVDRVSDPAFAPAAEARCEAAHAAVDELPSANETPDAQDRADVVEAANAEFESMLDDLEALAPAGEDGEITDEWIADWRTYLEDRAAFAQALRTDPEARLLVTAKDSEQITEFIDAFAADNKINACSTPLDV
jgi:hypothetical protein